MRNPFVVGNWVRGLNHYGRENLIDHILQGLHDAVWVVGTRRMGKTSLLRQLEYLTHCGQRYVPLFWDLQGSTDEAGLRDSLVDAVDEVYQRFGPLGINLEELEELELVSILRQLRRAVAATNRQFLLLIDEAEALISVGTNDAALLARLRRVLQGAQGLRTVMTSTKALSQINDLSRAWDTSPFLFGFALANLVGLSDRAAIALITCSRLSTPLQVQTEIVEAIREHTNNQPYLLQHLCFHLFQENGSLRPPTEMDLHPEEMLSNFFLIDFRHLSPTERRILLVVADARRIEDDALAKELDADPRQVENFSYGLVKLGYLRRVAGQLAVGNTFLARWLQGHRPQLAAEIEGAVSDQATAELLYESREQEKQYLREQLRIQRENRRLLETQRARYGLTPPLHLLHEISEIRSEIERLERELLALNSGNNHWLLPERSETPVVPEDVQ